MQLEEITLKDRLMLAFCNHRPDFKYIGKQRRAMNELASYGLAREAGSLRFELTEEGKVLADEFDKIPNNHNDLMEQIENILKKVELVTQY